jgi:epoxyqueuosine reductase
MLETYDRALASDGAAVSSAEDGRRRHAFDLGGDTPMSSMSPSQRVGMVPKMFSLMSSFMTSIDMARRPEGRRQGVATRALVAEVEAEARRLGATDVGYTQVPPSAVFAGKSIPYTQAIVVAMPMDATAVATAPSFECMRTVETTYAELGHIVNELTELLRRRGHAAAPGPALGGAVDYPLLAELAGLGARGANGLLISPRSGCCQRIAAVFTELSGLPEAQAENSHVWVRDFCARCRKCIRACPVDAIRDEPEQRPDGTASCTDGDVCIEYFGANWGCSVCVAVCPFTTRGYDKVKAQHLKAEAKRAARAGIAPP